MTQLTAVYPGTFDPLTRGHEDLVRRASNLFSKVVVGVAASRSASLFTLEERVDITTEALSGLSNVEVVGFNTLLVEFMRQYQARVVVRGVSNVADFEYEAQMATANKRLYPEMETIFLTPAECHGCISGTIVREIARHGGDVSEFVPPSVLSRLQQKF